MRPSRRRTGSPSPPWPSRGRCTGWCSWTTAAPRSRQAILWLDQRAAAEAASYADLPCEYTAVLGNRPSPGMAGPLLCWLMTHEPCTSVAAWWALQPKDWLRLRLTGQAATDPTDASGTLLFDLARNAWADPLVEKLGVPRGKSSPRSATRRASAGPLLPGPAADLGLRPGIPVAVGAADTAAALFAAGLRADEAMLNLGSGGQWVVLEDKFRPAPRCRRHHQPLPGRRRRLLPAGPGAERRRHPRLGARPPRSDLGRAVRHGVRARAGRTRRASTRTCPRSAGTRAPPAPATGLTLAHEREDLMRSALDGVGRPAAAAPG